MANKLPAIVPLPRIILVFEGLGNSLVPVISAERVVSDSAGERRNFGGCDEFSLRRVRPLEDLDGEIRPNTIVAAIGIGTGIEVDF
ncbi:hypothetical protein [uncultured Aliiroseovarius sp.]|uniref:hypothetical protein n=1 Tax=uncultured Aliiroseovarius sp. TaxID=1658783 RepID=UPI002601EAB8|nr:hypothetical protein [uncultured Aliiroseovarius sp.]